MDIGLHISDLDYHTFLFRMVITHSHSHTTVINDQHLPPGFVARCACLMQDMEVGCLPFRAS